MIQIYRSSVHGFKHLVSLDVKLLPPSHPHLIESSRVDLDQSQHRTLPSTKLTKYLEYNLRITLEQLHHYLYQYQGRNLNL